MKLPGRRPADRIRGSAWPEHRSRRRVGLAIVLLAILWLVVGFVRAPIVARDSIVASESPRAVSDLRSSTFPIIPPFFVVRVEATITEPGGASYVSARILGVEPFTGFVIDLGAG